jgi:hypothetical protein
MIQPSAAASGPPIDGPPLDVVPPQARRAAENHRESRLVSIKRA